MIKISATAFWLMMGLCIAVYVTGLFVPLMDYDAAHHATIALHMYYTGDYASLIHVGQNYLDKPHLLFWLAAGSFHLFGVTTFAYKLPSFLFALLGIYATYRLGKTLYNTETGRLAAIIHATAFTVMLTINDVRMDALLTASIAFASYQGIEWIKTKRLKYALGTALGLALGFATKGNIGVLVPAAGLLFYIAQTKSWRLLLHWSTLVIVVAFFLLIAPVLYAFYLQYDLHPEAVARERKNISGVRFILFDQVFERLEGSSFGSDGRNDYFFFIHSFLWTFLPWSLIAFQALFVRIKNIRSKQVEWFTIATVLVMAAVLTISKFKLPHYLTIICPAAAVLTAGFLQQLSQQNKSAKVYLRLQIVIGLLIILAAGAINVWAFPVHQPALLVCLLLILAIGVWLWKNGAGLWQKTVVLSSFISIATWLTLNGNFYPQLLTYQAGNELAKTVNEKIGAEHVYQEENLWSFSFEFYTNQLARIFSDSLLQQKKPVWVIIEGRNLNSWKKTYRLGTTIRHRDFNVSRISGRFINPATRRGELTELALIEVLGKK